jgi:excisionase family DNA binding protein
MHDAEHDATHATQQGETWATLAEAASFLGCSVDTVRRRIRRGELHAMRDAGRHGPTWRVLLSATPSVLPTVGTTPSSTPSVNGSMPSTTSSIGDDTAALLEALRLLDASRQENRDLAGQVGYLHARVQLQEETLRALQAPQQPMDAPTAPKSPDPTTGEPSVPWWRRWRAWVAAGLVVAVVGSVSCQPAATVRHGGLNWRQLVVDAGCCEGRASWDG